jgi:hypothetical protein
MILLLLVASTASGSATAMGRQRIATPRTAPDTKAGPEDADRIARPSRSKANRRRKVKKASGQKIVRVRRGSEVEAQRAPATAPMRAPGPRV